MCGREVCVQGITVRVVSTGVRVWEEVCVQGTTEHVVITFVRVWWWEVSLQGDHIAVSTSVRAWGREVCVQGDQRAHGGYACVCVGGECVCEGEVCVCEREVCVFGREVCVCEDRGMRVWEGGVRVWRWRYACKGNRARGVSTSGCVRIRRLSWCECLAKTTILRFCTHVDCVIALDVIAVLSLTEHVFAVLTGVGPGVSSQHRSDVRHDDAGAEETQQTHVGHGVPRQGTSRIIAHDVVPYYRSETCVFIRGMMLIRQDVVSSARDVLSPRTWYYRSTKRSVYRSCTYRVRRRVRSDAARRRRSRAHLP